MPVIYSPLSPIDERTAITWWANAFEDDPAIITAAFQSDPHRFARTAVAQEPDGQLHAAITYWIRLIRDTVGVPRRVAHIWGVGMPADTADAVRQQHVDQLIEWALQAARHERCELALFYPAPETCAHYTQRGWHLFPNRYRQGTFSGIQLPTTDAYTVSPYDPTHEPAGWLPLAAIYQAYNATRPASVVRDEPYWLDYLSWRWGEWSALGSSSLLVATTIDTLQTPCGYIIPKYYDDTFVIAEIAVAPSAPAALPMLMTGVLEEATRRGIADHFRVYLPSEPQIDLWVNQLFTPAPQVGEYGFHAVYALNEFAPTDLTAMFTVPESQSWLLDQF
jgi:hypothetical protein